MKQSEVLDSVVKYLKKKGWTEVFSNRPGNDFAVHGFVVPLKGKIIDSLLLKNDQLMLLETDSEISLKKGYHTKLLTLKEFLLQNQNLKQWVQLLEFRNKIKIGKIRHILLALAYCKTDFRFNLIKPELIGKGFHLYKVTPKGEVIEEHLAIRSKLNQFIKLRRLGEG